MRFASWDRPMAGFLMGRVGRVEDGEARGDGEDGLDLAEEGAVADEAVGILSDEEEVVRRSLRLVRDGRRDSSGDGT